MKKRRISLYIWSVVLIVLGLLYCLPFYFMLINSFKPFGEILTSFLYLPRQPTFENYIRAFNVLRFPTVFRNTVFITIITVIFSIVVSVMAGYKLERTAGKLARLIYYFFTFGIIIPFFVVMVPLIQQMSNMGLLNNQLTLILFYTGAYSSFGVFVSYGFSKSVPREIEESAMIDGAGAYRIFIIIILPLMKPIIATMAVLFVLWTWNDFIISFLFLTNRDLRTISPALFVFMGDMSVEWNFLLASIVISTLPILVFYAFAQKHIVKGLASGAIKG